MSCRVAGGPREIAGGSVGFDSFHDQRAIISSFGTTVLARAGRLEVECSRFARSNHFDLFGVYDISIIAVQVANLH